MVCSFAVAVDRRFKNASGEREADFVSCVAWNRLPNLSASIFRRAVELRFQGQYRPETMTTKDGKKVYVTEINVEQGRIRWRFKDRKKRAGDGQHVRRTAGEANQRNSARIIFARVRWRKNYQIPKISGEENHGTNYGNSQVEC